MCVLFLFYIASTSTSIYICFCKKNNEKAKVFPQFLFLFWRMKIGKGLRLFILSNMFVNVFNVFLETNSYTLLHK